MSVFEESLWSRLSAGFLLVCVAAMEEVETPALPPAVLPCEPTSECACALGSELREREQWPALGAPSPSTGDVPAVYSRHLIYKLFLQLLSNSHKPKK